MSKITRGDLIESMPDELEQSESTTPVRNYEQLIHAMQDVVDALRSNPTAEEVVAVLEKGVDSLIDMSDAADATLFVLDEQTRELNFVIVKGAGPAEQLKWRKLARGYGIAGWVAENAAHVVANDIQYDPRFCRWFDDELDYKTRTVLAVPIVKDGRVLGVIELLNKRDRGLFTNLDLAAATVFANLAGQALEALAARGGQARAR